MPTFNERLTALKRKAAEKQEYLERLNKTIERARENIKGVNKDLIEINNSISNIEARILTETLRKKGIDVSDVAAAIEAGVLVKPVIEMPPDISGVTDSGATYSTENETAENGGDKTDEEDTDDISDS